MFGTSENGEDVVYIGQARIRKNGNGMLGRILEPHPTIDYWKILSSLQQETIILDQQKLVTLKIDFVCVK